MKNIAFTGTLDPITKGHIYIIEEAAKIADNVMIVLADNANKKTLFSIEERIEMIEKSLTIKNYQIHLSKNRYVSEYIKDFDCDYMIRGVRNNADFDYENLVQQTNFEHLGGSKTIFIFPPKELNMISSSFVKALLGYDGYENKIKSFVSEFVRQQLIERVELTKK